MLASFLCLRGASFVLPGRGPVVQRGLPARGMPGIDVVVCVGDLRDGDLHVVMGGNVREARAECDRGRLCVSGMFMRLVLLSPYTLRAGWCAERVGASVSSRARALRHSMLHLSGIWRLLDTRARHSERQWRRPPSVSRAYPDRRSARESSSKCWVGAGGLDTRLRSAETARQMASPTYRFVADGPPVAAWYREETVEQVFAPTLARLARPRQEKGCRSIAATWCALDRDRGAFRIAARLVTLPARRAAKYRLAPIVGKGCRER